MEILWVLIPLSCLFWVIGVLAFFWCVDNKQLDDLDQAGKIALDLQELDLQEKDSPQREST